MEQHFSKSETFIQHVCNVFFIPCFVYFDALVNHLYNFYLCRREDTASVGLYPGNRSHSCLSLLSIHHKSLWMVLLQTTQLHSVLVCYSVPLLQPGFFHRLWFCTSDTHNSTLHPPRPVQLRSPCTVVRHALLDYYLFRYPEETTAALVLSTVHIPPHCRYLSVQNYVAFSLGSNLCQTKTCWT